MTHCEHLFQACSHVRWLGYGIKVFIAGELWEVNPNGLCYKAIYDELQPESTDAKNRGHHRKGNGTSCTPHRARS